MSLSLSLPRYGRSLLFLGLIAWGRMGAYADTLPSPFFSRHPACAKAVRAESTSFIRQFAKDDPRTQIIFSGPQAASVAKSLADDITMHRDFKMRQGEEKVVLLTLEQAEKAAEEPKFNDNTRIFVLATKELKGGLAPTLQRLCPVDLSQLTAGNGAAASRNLNPRAGHLAFSMAVVAPDAERLQTMMGLFSQPYTDYKGMLTPITDKFATYRLAIFSAEADRDSVEKWGRVDAKNIWPKYEWYPLSAFATLTPEQREDRQFVFFLNRADRTQVAPEPAQALLKDQRLNETTSVVTRGIGPNGLPCIVFSSPSPTLLRRRSAQYDRIDAVPANPALDEAADLRSLNRSVLLVHGAGLKLTPDDAASIRSQTIQMMRDRLKLPIEELGGQFDALQKEIVFQDPAAATETAQRIREKSGVRYVWLLQVTDYAGKTIYAPSQKLTTAPPPPYVMAHPEDKEPVEPTLDIGSGRGKQAQYEKDKAAWQPLHDAWKNRKLAYERYGETQYPCTWEYKIEKQSLATVKGVLRLIDMDHPNTPLWEKACVGRRAENSEFTSRTVQVRGTKNQPPPLPVPPNEATCSVGLLQQAGIAAGSAAVFSLSGSALLSDGKPGAPQFQVQERDRPVVPSGAASISKVAYVDENGVTLKIDPNAGIQKGLWIDIPLSVIDIPDPDNPGKLLSHKIVEKVVLRVVSVRDNVAECVPVSEKEKAKLSRVKLGMAVGDAYSSPESK